MKKEKKNVDLSPFFAWIVVFPSQKKIASNHIFFHSKKAALLAAKKDLFEVDLETGKKERFVAVPVTISQGHE